MNTTSPSVGLLLANRVASALQAGRTLAYVHRDYCGIGLCYVDQVFVHGQVDDGVLPSPKPVGPVEEGDGFELKTFGSRDEFVSWLAVQTDESLSGRTLKDAWLRDNQRLTIARLMAFVSEG